MEKAVARLGTAVSWGTSLRRKMLLGLSAAGVLVLAPSPAEAEVNAVISSISALRARPVTDGTVLVGGYHGDADGGGGLFYGALSSGETDNGGTIIAPTNGLGRWKRVVTEPFNVKWWGARGDGRTDDREAIQRALDNAVAQARTLTGSATVLFPGGKYLVNSMASGSALHLRLQNGSRNSAIKLHLQGTGDAILFANKTSAPAVTNDILLYVSSNFSDLLIENLTFQRPAIPAGGGKSVACQLDGDLIGNPGPKRPIIRNCSFQDFSQGIILGALTEGALVTSCHWRYTKGRACAPLDGGVAVGLLCWRTIQTQVVDNYWAGTEDLAFTPLDGFVKADLCHGIVIKNNIVRRSDYEGIFVQTALAGESDNYPYYTNSTCIIEGNYVDNESPGGGSRIGIAARDYDIVVSGNTVRHTRAGISVDTMYPHEVTVRGGIVANNNIILDQADATSPGGDIQLAGIYLHSRRDLTVQNNRVFFQQTSGPTAPAERAPSCGIFLANCDTVRVVGNVVYADPPTVGSSPPYGVCGVYLMWKSQNIAITGNSFRNLGVGIAGNSANPSTPYSQIGHNDYYGLRYAIGAYNKKGTPDPLWGVGASESVVDLSSETPAGWYRVFQGVGYIGGSLSVAGVFSPDQLAGVQGQGNLYPAAILDGQFMLEYDHQRLGAIHQLQGGRAPLYVDQVRVAQSSTSSAWLAVDVHVASTLPAKVRLVFTANDGSLEPKRYGSVYGVPKPFSVTLTAQRGGYVKNEIDSLAPAANSELSGIFTSGAVLSGKGFGGVLQPPTTTGSIIKKIQAFDANGNFIGWIPVYNSL
jgi:hypothetical protein